MHFSIDQEDATTVFRLKEPKLDSVTASQLKAEFLILAQPDVETLIVDLSAVEYCDSAGLSSLLLAQRQMSGHGGDVRLVGLRPDVLSLLRLTQLDRVFPIFETVDAALDSEPSFGDDDDDLDAALLTDRPLAPGAPSVHDIKSGAIAAGGSFGAAALVKIMMSPYEENLDELQAHTNGEFLAFDDDFDDDDDEEDLDDELDDELDDVDEDDAEDDDAVEEVDEVDEEYEDEDLDEEDDVEEGDIEEDLLEDDDFEDDDFDDEELEEDDVDTY